METELETAALPDGPAAQACIMTGGPWPLAPRRLPPAHLLAAFDSASSALLPRLNLSRDSDGLGPHLSVTLNLACFTVFLPFRTRQRRSPRTDTCGNIFSCDPEFVRTRKTSGPHPEAVGPSFYMLSD